jgi:hypothetical protein
VFHPSQSIPGSPRDLNKIDLKVTIYVNRLALERRVEAVKIVDTVSLIGKSLQKLPIYTYQYRICRVRSGSESFE